MDLEALGAVVITTKDFPLVTNYERETFPGQSVNVPGWPPDWNATERGAMIAHAWNDFLIANGDPNCPSLSAVDTTQIWPAWDPKSVQVRYSEPANAIRWSTLSAHLSSDPAQNDMLSLPGLPKALHALEAARKRDFEDWLDANDIHCVVFPANGDIGRADADVNDASSRHAWTNGVKYSNGKRAIRHLGVPTVSVPMGIMEDTGMPVNLTFAGKAYEDCNLLSFAYAYEQATHKRMPPRLTPSLPLDVISMDQNVQYPIDKSRQHGLALWSRPKLEIVRCHTAPVGRGAAQLIVEVSGSLSIAISSIDLPPGRNLLDYLLVYINGVVASVTELEVTSITGTVDQQSWSWKCSKMTPPPTVRDERTKVGATIARDQTMVVVVAKAKGGGASGSLRLL